MLKKQTLLDNEKGQVRSNIVNLKQHFRSTYFTERSKWVRAYNLDSTDRAMMDTWCEMVESDYYRPLIKRTIDTFFNQLYDTQSQYEVHELGWEESCLDWDWHWEKYVNSSDKIEDIVEDSFQDPDARKNFFTSTKVMAIVGNGYWKAWIRDNGWYPETTIKEVWPFSLFFFPNQNFYDSWMPVLERKICSMKNIMEELVAYWIDIKQFKREYNLMYSRHMEENKKKHAKQQKWDRQTEMVIHHPWDKQDDEKIWEGKFYSEHLKNCKDQCCPRCKKDECSCTPFERSITPMESKDVNIYSLNISDQLHEFVMYWTMENLYIYVDDLLFLKYQNPISNPLGDMDEEDKKKLKSMQVKLARLSKKKVTQRKNMERDIEEFENMFEVDISWSYHPYYKLDIDPNSRAEIQMWIWPTYYKDQLLYNDVYNKFMDDIRLVWSLKSSFIKDAADDIRVLGWTEIKNWTIPLKPWQMFEISGDWPRAWIRSLWEWVQIDYRALDVLNYLDFAQDRSIGLTSVTWWAEKGIQRVPWAVEALRQVTLQQLSPLVESIGHSMGKVVHVRQKLLLNYMYKKDLKKIDIRKRRGWRTELTREDLKKKYHIIVSNKSLTTLQNFSTTMSKINAIGQIQPLLVNPVTWDPLIGYLPIVKQLLQDLDLPCDVELTRDEIMDMKTKAVKDETKIQILQTKESKKVQFADFVSTEKMQERLRQRQALAWEALQAEGQPTDWASQVETLSEQELQQLSQVYWVPVEELRWITPEEVELIEQQLWIGQPPQETPLVEQFEWNNLIDERTDIVDPLAQPEQAIDLWVL